MSEEKKVVKPAESTTASGASTSGVEKDDKGVLWENRAKEYERKLGELSGRYEKLETYVSENVKPVVPEPNVAEEARLAKLEALAADPQGYIDQQVAVQLNKQKIETSVTWLEAQKEYKPEFKEGVRQIIRNNGMSGDPMKVVDTAWKLYKMDNPDKFENERSSQVDSREQDVNQYRTAGPGRIGAVKQTDARKELLKELSKAQGKSLSAQAEIMRQIRENPLE